MPIHHLNCGTLRARFPRADAITYCLLIESSRGLILIDTGFGLKDYTDPSTLMRGFLFLMGTPRDIKETAAHQVEALGYDRRDVKHIVVSHLHLDHAGGLPDFPQANVHLHRAEYEAAMNPRGLIERAYDPSHWKHRPDWVLYDEPKTEWMGFEAIPILEELTPRILLIPLPGHTRGHCGVAIERDGGWLFQCGDAASPLHRDTDLHQYEENPHAANILPGWFTRRVIGPHVPRLRSLVRDHKDEVTVISSHDIFSFKDFRRAQGQ